MKWCEIGKCFLSFHKGLKFFLVKEYSYGLLEIKPYRLGSRIRDMEAESDNESHFLVNV